MKVFAVFLTILSSTFGLNILAVLHHSMKSHQTIAKGIIDSLLEAGHNVTALTHNHDVKHVGNYQTVQIPDIMGIFEAPDSNAFSLVDMPVIFTPFVFPFFGIQMVNTIMSSTDIYEFMDRNEIFDVCILELFIAEALLGIAERSGCSIIQYTTFDALMWSDSVLGNQSPPSFVSHPWLPYGDKMTFKERLWNTLYHLIENFNYKYIHYWTQKYLYNKYFPNAKRSFDEMYRNSSLIFINNHVSSSFVRPRLPTQIEIGGIHVKKLKPLPFDLQSFLDSAADGVIFFSMGSYIDGTDWSLEQREIFLKVFGKLKQKVIWRYSNETLPGNPGNIFIGSWFPQRDILAHPNVKVFITHGGLLGTTEAIVEGVPVLGIPIFGDQMMNMAKTVARGYGLQIAFHDISEKSLTESLGELLTNPVYKTNAKEVSRRYNDRPRTPQQEVVYWTEYVARHHGAAHLQARSVNMNIIELNLIDVYAVIIIVLLVLFYINFKLFRILMTKFFAISQRKAKEKNQ